MRSANQRSNGGSQAEQGSAQPRWWIAICFPLFWATFALAVEPTAGSASTVPAVSVLAATRLLDQATFGPTTLDVTTVQKLGISGYIAQQFAASPTYLPKVATPVPSACIHSKLSCVEGEWWQTALTANDQLRQRVAFTLSEIFVVSTSTVNPVAIIPFQNLLVKDAFGNFQDLLRDVTLSTAMGEYLNMVDSAKPAAGQAANENYARELLQLMSTGIYQLNQDGSLLLSASGAPQPVYTQAQVQTFARAFTGWTYAEPGGASAPSIPNKSTNFDAQMAPVENAHDSDAKPLLGGVVLPAGQSAEQDLAAALNNIFMQPSVGPFLCRQLIQHLVTGNPSPAYVQRVAAVFASDAHGVRGDLQAVVAAILTDPEARAGDAELQPEGGHLREPILFVTGVLRALDVVPNSFSEGYSVLTKLTSTLGEEPYAAPSVFNFYPSMYTIPGSSLHGPEFALENTASIMLRLTSAENIVFNTDSSMPVNLSPQSALGKLATASGNAVNDSGALVDALGVLFLHGAMPSEMRASIVNHIAGLPNASQRIRVAVYLIITSSEYKIVD